MSYPIDTGTVDYKSNKTARWLMDLFFPVRCLGCGQFTDTYLCSPCLSKVPIGKKFECIECKREMPQGLTCIICRGKNSVDQLLITGSYEYPVLARALKVFKYYFVNDMAYPLSDLAGRYIRLLLKRKKINIFKNNPLLTFVPLHPRRFNWRGFNQSELLATNLAKKFFVKCEPLLVRKKHNKPQAEIEDRDSRALNVKSIFMCPDASRVKGREVIVLDDVCTTGATLNECARVLKSVGATKVVALVIARG